MASGSTSQSAGAARIRRNKLWFRVHSLVGVNVSLFLALIFLTGTVSVFSSEIDWLTQPQMRAATATHADDIAWERIVTSLVEFDPPGQIQSIEAGPSSIFAPAAFVRRPDGGTTVVYFDPALGTVLGEGSRLGAKPLLRAIHSRLLLSDQIGITLVTLSSFFLITSLLTAMAFYKGWWRGFFLWPRRGKGKRTFWSDLHRLLGVWAIVPGIITGITGAWYFAEQAFARSPNFETPEFAARELSNREVATAFPETLATVRRAYPDLSIRRIVWPGQSGAGFTFYGQDGTLLVRPRASGIGIDATGTVRLRHSARDASLHQRISEAADPLHTGSWGGYPTRIVWFLFGLMLTILAISGARIYLARLAAGASANSIPKSIAKTGPLIAMPIVAAGIVLYCLPGMIAALR